MKTKLFAALLMLGLLAMCLPMCKAQPLTGYNAAWFFNQFPGGYPPQSTIDQIKALQPDLIRFPGGTSSFLYATDRLAYGYEGDMKPNYAGAQVRLTGEIGCQTIYVANLYQPLIRPKDEAYWIADIVKAVKILNPVALELGNEFPIYPELNGGYKNGDPNIFQKKTYAANVTAAALRYVELCRKVMSAVREAGYNPKFGVVMDQPLHTRGRTWNAAIRSAGLAYDGEIFHYYTLKKSFADLKAELVKIIAGAKGEVWITEYWYQFSHTGTKNLSVIKEPFYKNLDAWFSLAFAQLGVDVAIRHQLYGTSEYSAIKKQ